MELYRRAGVHHAWITSWQGRTLEVFRRQSEGWLRVATFSGDTRVRAEPFDAVELDLSQLWTFLPPIPQD
jgi:Uma2 family endonuclease